jgi:hypothetical protein
MDNLPVRKTRNTRAWMWMAPLLIVLFVILYTMIFSY